MNKFCSSLTSLKEGRWFKLICGASYQHLPAIHDLALVYALAGADCVDVAADPAVIRAAQSGLAAAESYKKLSTNGIFNVSDRPLLMVSLNDGDDPHFRKATFDPAICPPQCHRPCEAVCPTEAIVFDPHAASGVRNNGARNNNVGVLAERCYGCGRCVSICPVGQIETRSYRATLTAIAPSLLSAVDAVEIHTQIGRENEFKTLWQAIAYQIETLKAVAVSCPDGPGLIDYLRTLYDLMGPLPMPLIWQTDGRPMSGDIGKGTTHAAIRLGQKVLQAGLPGYVQLAGGTNLHTVPKLNELGLLGHTNLPKGRHKSPAIAGVAYGSYARQLVMPILGDSPLILPSLSSPSLSVSTQDVDLERADARVPHTIQSMSPEAPTLQLMPTQLHQAVEQAKVLVNQIKRIKQPDTDNLQQAPSPASVA